MTTCTASRTGTAVTEELVRSHLPLVGHLVRELLSRVPAHVSREDLLSAGMAALAAADDDVQRAVVLSLQGFAPGTAEDLVPERSAGPEDLILHRERIGYLRDAVEALPERLRTVVTRYFFEERPMAEIAAELGVTESRVSQLRGEALGLLRDGLNTHLDPELVAGPAKPAGCVTRRREGYFS